jgi:hypothetical protein
MDKHHMTTNIANLDPAVLIEVSCFTYEILESVIATKFYQTAIWNFTPCKGTVTK